MCCDGIFITEFGDTQEMNGRPADGYKHWRQTEADLVPVTIEMQIRTLSVFLKWCESNEYVHPGVAEMISRDFDYINGR